MDIEKWKLAVLHLECATDSLSFEEFRKLVAGVQDELAKGERPRPEKLDELWRRSKDVRTQGTALFVGDEDRHYLVTARHVLTDAEAAKRARSGMLGGSDREAEYIDNWIYPIIFRISSLDEFKASKSLPKEFLMNLASGVTGMHAYTFSEPSIDLAIISLNQRRTVRFRDDLFSAGFEPVHLDDIGDGPSNEGAKLFSVGYPLATAKLAKLPLDPAQAYWSSSLISVPIFSFGRVAMRHDDLSYFWADISVYPGNSGGPVVAEDKLIGIVSKQAIVEGARIPFARATNAGLLRDLFAEQAEKDRVRASRGI